MYRMYNHDLNIVLRHPKFHKSIILKELISKYNYTSYEDFIYKNIDKSFGYCGFCNKYYAKCNFELKIVENEIFIINISHVREFMCTERECIDNRKHINPNSFEGVSKRKRIPLEDAKKWLLENNNSPFYYKEGQSYEEYKKSQSRGYEYFVEKYGKDEGEKKYKSHCNKSKKRTYEYYVEKYGKDEADRINDMKRNTLENFIKRHGEIEGRVKYANYIKKTTKIGLYTQDNLKIPSKKAFNFLNDLNTLILENLKLEENDIIFANGKQHEFRINYYDKNEKYRWIDLDYYIKPYKLDIEFHGKNFHFDEKRENIHGIIDMEERKNRKIRRDFILNELGIEEIVVWDYEVKNKLDYSKKLLEVYNIITEKIKNKERSENEIKQYSKINI